MTTLTEIMNACYVQDEIIKIPSEQIEPKLFRKVKIHFETHGFKWKGGKTWGFAPTGGISAADALASILEAPDEDMRQKYQFFETNPSLINDLLMFADCFYSEYDEQPPKILEPSAGRGAIIQEIINRFGDKCEIYACELWDINYAILQKKFPQVKLIGRDFMELKGYKNFFDYIIANPPFTNNQDIDHIKKMYDHLAFGGSMASITSTSWLRGSHKKQKAFQEFTNQIEAGCNTYSNAFVEAGTTIDVLLWYANKLDDRKFKINHLKSLEDLLWKCGVLDINVQKTYADLLLLEDKYCKLTNLYCEGKIETDEWPHHEALGLKEVQALFANNLKGLFINTDPRGHALKIDGEILAKEYPEITKFNTDLGRDVILATKFKS